MYFYMLVSCKGYFLVCHSYIFINTNHNVKLLTSAALYTCTSLFSISKVLVALHFLGRNLLGLRNCCQFCSHGVHAECKMQCSARVPSTIDLFIGYYLYMNSPSCCRAAAGLLLPAGVHVQYRGSPM